MRKIFTALALTALLPAVLLTGCNSAGSQSGAGGVLMNYQTGEEGTEIYRDMFFDNKNETSLADPGVFYVSEEEDEEWGGYYYMYGTGSTSGYTTSDGQFYAFTCFRSSDLTDWKLVGEYDKGNSLLITASDWIQTGTEICWAPEVIRNPQDGKYYMYFNACAKPSATLQGSATDYDRLYIGVAVGDTPTSFRLVGSAEWAEDADGNVFTSERPPIDFERALGLDGVFSIIDANPFLDDDGTLYLYFNKHTDGNPKTPSRMGIWGIRMRDFVTPDYESLTLCTLPNVVSCEGGIGEDGEPTVFSRGAAYNFSEGSINEGPFMVKHNGKYYLTYSGNGYTSPAYSVHQAIADSPLGKFVKPQTDEGNPVLYSSKNYVSGTGHHSIVKAGDDLMIVYARMGNPSNYGMGWMRIIGIDSCYFVDNGFGLDVLTSNGPSYSLQPLPASISGYKNYAPEARVTVSDGKGATNLNDKIVPYYTFSQDRVYQGSVGSTITLSWGTPVPASAVMVYNSSLYDYAFKDIASIRLYFTQRPSWASQEYLWGEMRNIAFPEKYIFDNNLYSGAAATVLFEEVYIDRIVITLGGKLEEYDAMGELFSDIIIPEIVVLGKEA